MKNIHDYVANPCDCKPSTHVAAGAAWLDATCPGWERKIDLSILDLSNAGADIGCEQCNWTGVVPVETWTAKLRGPRTAKPCPNCRPEAYR